MDRGPGAISEGPACSCLCSAVLNGESAMRQTRRFKNSLKHVQQLWKVSGATCGKKTVSDLVTMSHVRLARETVLVPVFQISNQLSSEAMNTPSARPSVSACPPPHPPPPTHRSKSLDSRPCRRPCPLPLPSPPLPSPPLRFLLLPGLSLRATCLFKFEHITMSA